MFYITVSFISSVRSYVIQVITCGGKCLNPLRDPTHPPSLLSTNIFMAIFLWGIRSPGLPWGATYRPWVIKIILSLSLTPANILEFK